MTVSPAHTATVIWDGDDPEFGDNWTTDGNWFGGVAPSPGDSLVFGFSQQANNNDFPPNTPFDSITFTNEAWVLTGNPINLTSPGIGVLWMQTGVPSSPIVLDLPLTFTSAATISNAAPAAALIFSQGITNGGNPLVVGDLSGGTVILQGPVVGSGGLTKVGSGTLQLGSSGNDYRGNTIVSAGVLKLAAKQALPSGVGYGDVEVDSVLDLHGNTQFINGLTGTGIVTNSSSTMIDLTVCLQDTVRTFTFDGYLQGAMNFTKVQAGPTLILTRPNSYSGATAFRAGTLQLGANNALPPTTPLTMGALGKDVTLDLAGFDQRLAGLSKSTTGNCVITNSSTARDSTLTFSNTATPSVYLGRIVDGASRKINVTVAGGTLTLKQAFSTYRGLTLVTNTGSKLIVPTTQTGGGPFAVADGASLGVIVSTKKGALAMSTLTLGTSLAHNGTLDFNLGEFGTSTNAPIQTKVLSTHGTVTINVAGLGVEVGQFPLIKYSGAIGGAGFAAFTLGSLPAGAAGELINNSLNSSVDLKITSYAGSLVWSGTTNNLPASSWDIGLTADWTDLGTGLASTYSEGGLSGPLVLFDDTASNGVVTVMAEVKPYSITINNSTLDYTIGGPGNIAGAASVSMEGAGVVTLTSSNTYSGDTTIGSGTLRLGASGAIPSGAGAGNVILNGTLDLAGVASTINGLAGSGIVDNSVANGILSVGGNNQSSTFNGVIQNTAGSLSLRKIGSGLLALSGTNTYAGSTEIKAGTLAVTTAGQPPGPIEVANKASLSLTVSGLGVSLKTSDLALGSGGADVTTNSFDLGDFGNPIDPIVHATNLTVNGLNVINIAGSGLSVGQFSLIKYDGAIGGSGYSFTLGSLPVGVGAFLSNAPSAVQLVVFDPGVRLWTGASNVNWGLGGVLNWQLDGLPIAYHDGDTVLFDSTGTSRSHVNLPTDLTPGSITVNDASYTLSGPGSLNGSANLSKTGTGTLTLNVPDRLTGLTTIAGGVLRLGTNGLIASSQSILVASNALLDVSSLSNGLVIGSGSSLAGYGTVAGSVTIGPGGILAPGSAPGTLTFSQPLNLQGTAVMQISKSGGVVAGNLVKVNGQLHFGGASALTVQYQGDPLIGGEVFHLFDAQSFDGALYSWTLPPLGPGLDWSFDRLTTDGTISVNRAPIAANLAMQTAARVPLFINVANLLALCSDPDGDRLALNAIGSPSHGVATLDPDGVTLTYTPDAAYTGADQFTYVIGDGHGGSGTGTNSVLVAAENDSTHDEFSDPIASGGSVELSFSGFPGDSYTIQRSTNLVDWVDILTEVVPPSGRLSFDDPTMPSPPPPYAFYRAVFELGSGEVSASRILQATGVKGGFVAHVGCGNGELTAALQQNASYLVQGLDRNPANVKAARQYITSLGIYGPVSADHWDGAHLPYIDGFVNLVVVQDMGTMTTNEVTRVLAPLGVAYIQQGGSWHKIVKPRPPEISEWTHYAYDASGVCVAPDTVVGPPKRYQWLAGPRFNRHHDVMSSFNAGVSANGRLFHVMDEGSRESVLLPGKWSLIARDAFSGTLLWKRAISSWHPSMYGLKSGPTQLTRRLVAVGDVVYVTLDYYGPVVALDAATGATIRTYDQTTAAQELYWSGGTLFVLVDPAPKQWAIWEDYYNTRVSVRGVPSTWWEDHPRILTAVNATTGKVLWTNTSTVYPTSIAVDPTGVVYHNGTNVVKVDRGDGHQLWVSDQPIPVLDPTFTANGLSMILYSNVVVMAGGPGPANTPQDQNSLGFIWSVDSTSGHVLAHWQHGKNSHVHSPNDLFAFNGLVWSTAAASNNPVCTGYDPRSGAVVKTINPHLDIDWIHERCYRSKATVRYFLTSRACLEFIDTQEDLGLVHDWVRAACLYGFIPCNGMVYTTPNDCSCQFLAKLTGLGALAPASADPNYPHTDPDTSRLEQGPAYTAVVSANPSPEDWPIYRHDQARSGYTANTLPSTLRVGWQTSLGGKLSSLTVAEGRVFVASVDTHTVRALDADTGASQWTYTVGGRVDSPPTIYQGRVLFGSADGSVYCLRATDGALIWRFLGAPTDLRHMSYEQIESVWPVSGSVLVQNDKVYCVSGRSMYLDGGCRFLALNPTNGVKLIEQVMDDKIPGTTNSLTTLEKTFNAPVALTDLLSSDGTHIFMKSQMFDLNGVRTNIAPISSDVAVNAAWINQIGDGVHLFTPTGFLDDSWMHRSYWVWGRSWSSGAGGYYQAGKNAPCGQLLSIDDTNVYGFGRMPQYYQWTLPKENMLFSTSSANNFYTGNPYTWTNTLPFFVKAMVASKDYLFLAGPPDLEDEEETFNTLNNSQTQAVLANQDAALNGSQGGQLRVVDKSSGATLSSYSVDFLPVWDGMAAAGQSLYLATRDGRVVCMR